MEHMPARYRVRNIPAYAGKTTVGPDGNVYVQWNIPAYAGKTA